MTSTSPSEDLEYDDATGDRKPVAPVQDKPPLDPDFADLPLAVRARVEEMFTAQRPRDVIRDYARMRIADIQVRISVDGTKVMDGWLRELAAMVAARKLVDWMEDDREKEGSGAR